jgi:hypothetical protein
MGQYLDLLGYPNTAFSIDLVQQNFVKGDRFGSGTRAAASIA